MRSLEDLTEPEMVEYTNTVCHAIEFAAEHHGVEKPLFAVLLFNDPKFVNYAANCRREDVIKAMRECANRLEQREDFRR